MSTLAAAVIASYSLPLLFFPFHYHSFENNVPIIFGDYFLILLLLLLKSPQEKHSPAIMDGAGYRGTDPEPRRSKSSSPISCSSVSGAQPIDDELEDESVSEVGDIGDRALHSNRNSPSHTYNDLYGEGVLLPSYGFWCRDNTASRTIPTVPLPEDFISQTIDVVVCNEVKKQVSFQLICSCCTQIFYVLEHGQDGWSACLLINR